MSDTKPAANSPESIQVAVAHYRQQHEQATLQLAQLEQNYHNQKDQLTSTLLMLSGAVAALEQVVKNIADEAAAAQGAQGAQVEVPDPTPAVPAETTDAPSVA